MTVRYYIDADYRMVVTTVSGVVDASQLYLYQDKLRKDANFQPDMFEFMDCLKLQDVKLGSILLPRFVKGSPWAKTARRAIIVPNPKVYALLRFFQVFMSNANGEISIFNNAHGAKEWLALGSRACISFE